MLLQRLDAYERLIRLDKPIGTLLLLWPTLTALFLAQAQMAEPGEPWYPPLPILWVFILGTLLMRSAGCAFNDFADRHIDGHVSRTFNRPLPAGEIMPWEAVAVAVILALSALALIWTMPSAVKEWALYSVLVAAVYPFSKRFLRMPQGILGIAFSMGIPMAYAAQMHVVNHAALVLMAINWLWVIAYDTEYAMCDREDDNKLAIGTSAKLFGRFDVAAVMGCYAAYLLAMGGWGYGHQRGAFYYLGLVVAAGIALYHFHLIKDRDPSKCFKAFLHNHWLGLAVLAGVVVDNYFLLRAV
ncbi:MAG: 4-hydroxybenzoate octaprenyltransferase [Pseudomonadota bacterium]|jgi:4-hydroxybenzoate polyprenyltransferase